MTPDLRLVAYSVVLTWLMIVTQATFGSEMWTPEGRKRGMGNRDGMPEPKPIGGRAKRAAANMLENLPLFIGLVLAAHVGGAKATTVLLGARIWFYARVAYWFIYLAGIPVVRTLVWVISIVGLGIIFSAIVSA